MYISKKNGVQKKIWRCVHFKNKFRGRVHVIGDIDNERISKKIDHNHVPDITQIEVKTAISEMKINAKCTSNSTHSVIGTLASQVHTILFL